jgi:hypothetical protein
MMVNIAKLTTERMLLQNAADNAAVSAAVYRARTLNTLAMMNLAIARLMYGGDDIATSNFWTYNKYAVTAGIIGSAGAAIPLFPMGGIDPAKLPGKYAYDSQEGIAGYLDVYSGGHPQMEFISGSVRALSEAQRKIADYVYPAESMALANELSKRNGADSALITRGLTIAGLCSNTNGTVYCEPEKLDWARSLVVKGGINALLALIGSPVIIKEIFEAKKWNTGTSSWMYITKDEFDRGQKITVIAATEGDSKAYAAYPLFGKWFGIKWPKVMAVASAAPYNTAGPMFPVEDAKRPSDSIAAVIKAYENGRAGGWDAHLVPVREAGILH